MLEILRVGDFELFQQGHKLLLEVPLPGGHVLLAAGTGHRPLGLASEASAQKRIVIK